VGKVQKIQKLEQLCFAAVFGVVGKINDCIYKFFSMMCDNHTYIIGRHGQKVKCHGAPKVYSPCAVAEAFLSLASFNILSITCTMVFCLLAQI
jgi:hypothetical protein